MRLAFVDPDGTLHSAVHRICTEGHDVLYFITGPEEEPDNERDREMAERAARIGEGLVDRAHSYDDIVSFDPDVVVTYNSVPAHEWATQMAYPTWGSTPASVKLEADRMFAAHLARRYGVGVVPVTLRFTDPETAMKKIQSIGGQRWVFKAEGTHVSTSTTHVCDSLDHLHDVMTYEQERGATAFVLQEHVQGVEISTEGWFDYRVRGGWLYPINSTLERKRMFAGDVGPMSGAMGSVVWAWEGTRPRLFTETLLGLTPYLRAIEYVGPIDVNCIVTTDGHRPHFLEFTPRLGWDAFEAQMIGWQGSVGEFFVRLGEGTATQLPISTRDFMVAVRGYIPAAEDVPVMIPRDHENFFLKDVRYEHPADDPGILVEREEGVGGDGAEGPSLSGRLLAVGVDTDNGFAVICEVAHTGETIHAAADPIYEHLMPQVQAPDLTFRTDIGADAQRSLDQLEAWGYETPGSEYQPWIAGAKTALGGRRRG